jgi:hypothetical protein
MYYISVEIIDISKEMCMISEETTSNEQNI